MVAIRRSPSQKKTHFVSTILGSTPETVEACFGERLVVRRVFIAEKKLQFVITFGAHNSARVASGFELPTLGSWCKPSGLFMCAQKMPGLEGGGSGRCGC